MGRVSGGECQVEKERFVRRGGNKLAQPLAGRVDDGFGQVVLAVMGSFDALVAEHQLRVPLVGLARRESVEAVEAALQGPMVVGPGRACLVDGHLVPLARSQRLVAMRAQHLRQVRRFPRSEAAGIRKPIHHLGDPAHADAVVIAARQQAGAGGRAQWCHVKVGIAQAIGRQAVEGGRLDIRAIASDLGIADIVQDDHDDIGALFELGRCRPPGNPGLVHRASDLAVELPVVLHSVLPCRYGAQPCPGYR